MASQTPRKSSSTCAAITAAVQFALSDPILTGTLLGTLLWAPESAKARLPSLWGAGSVGSSSFLLVLKLLVTFNVVRFASGVWSRWALNNFVSDESWDWTKEIVVLTGGSYGLGELVACRLGDRGIKVIVLARTKPKGEFREFETFFTNERRAFADERNSA